MRRPGLTLALLTAAIVAVGIAARQGPSSPFAEGLDEALFGDFDSFTLRALHEYP